MTDKKDSDGPANLYEWSKFSVPSIFEYPPLEGDDGGGRKGLQIMTVKTWETVGDPTVRAEHIDDKLECIAGAPNPKLEAHIREWLDDMGARLFLEGIDSDRIPLGILTGTTSEQASAAGDGAMTLGKLSEAIDRVKALGHAPPSPVRIVESVHMVDRHEDWSNVRSPSRTRRRMRYNACRIYTYTPKREAFAPPDGAVVMHPVMAAEVREALKESKP